MNEATCKKNVIDAEIVMTEKAEAFFDRLDMAGFSVPYKTLKKLVAEGRKDAMVHKDFCFYVGKLDGQKEYEAKGDQLPTEYFDVVDGRDGLLKGLDVSREDMLKKTREELDLFINATNSSDQNTFGFSYVNGLSAARNLHEIGGGIKYEE